ncbi:DUF1998 domain-containing protein [Sphingomonas limnosediminicola]|uniref:DUF1998 domain-containing protein n=1 Tax=Sphingomonas limnosediminicola TaxID=940133 RepID=A0ABP7L7K9_9SPHN
MAKPTVRSAQLISPFGVGSLCEVDGQSLFVRGTGSWERGFNLEDINVTSLAQRLRPKKLKRPRISIAVTRFPRWHFCPECRQMTFWSYQRDKDERRDDGSLPRPTCGTGDCNHARLVPMRFVAVCDNGHLDEIDWYWWAHREHQQAAQGPCDRKSARLRFEVSGKSGGDFSSMRISCSCKASGSLEGIADGPLPQKCKGKQPGEEMVDCKAKDGAGPAKLYMEPRGSSALHYASVLSALDIAGDSDRPSWATLKSDEVYLGLVKAAEHLARLKQEELLEGAFKAPVTSRAQSLGVDPEDAWECFLEEVMSAEDESSPAPTGDFSQETILGEEFPVLADPAGQQTKWLITRPAKLGATHGLNRLLDRVVRVERLREVRAFRGFQRRNVTENQAVVSPSLGRSQPDWLPSIQVLGEGVFVEFSRQALKDWLTANEPEITEFTRAHLASAERLGLPSRMGFNATPAFIMVHTFSHLMINQLSFDCGYSSTSLRERVYCGPNNNPYAGILIYTADSDAEGSMGGLSEMGAPERIEDVVYRAVARSQWCSGDPVCRELDAQGVDGLNRASCHACSLVAETSCTFSNVLLDRVLVAGDGRENGRGVREPVGFFREVAGV